MYVVCWRYIIYYTNSSYTTGWHLSKIYVHCLMWYEIASSSHGSTFRVQQKSWVIYWQYGHQHVQWTMVSLCVFFISHQTWQDTAQNKEKQTAPLLIFRETKTHISTGIVFRMQPEPIGFLKRPTWYSEGYFSVTLSHSYNISQDLFKESNETPNWCNSVQVLFLQGHSTFFGRKRTSSGVFKTSTAATGTCVIVAGKSSHLLIRVGRP